jgi:hypothetical protein
MEGAGLTAVTLAATVLVEETRGESGFGGSLPGLQIGLKSAEC